MDLSTTRVTKATLADLLCDRIGGMTKREAALAIDEVFELLKDTIVDNDKVKISGFGNFVAREKQPRRGRNPQTGESLTIEARRVLTFRSSQLLRGEINTDDVDLDVEEL